MGFERGKNIKETIGIGILGTIKKEMTKTYWFYDGPCSVLKWAAVERRPEYIKWAVENGAREWLGNHPGDFAMQSIADWPNPNPELLDYLAENGANMYIIGYFSIRDKFYNKNPGMMKVIRKHYPEFDDHINPWLRE